MAELSDEISSEKMKSLADKVASIVLQEHGLSLAIVIFLPVSSLLVTLAEMLGKSHS